MNNVLQSGLSHVLPLFGNVRKTSYTSSSHVMLVQRHGSDLNNIWISFKSDIYFCKLDFSFLSLFCFPLVYFFSDIQEFNKIFVMSILNGKAGISLSLPLPLSSLWTIAWITGGKLWILYSFLLVLLWFQCAKKEWQDKAFCWCFKQK